tara:strand:+ start:660 stop:1553 length:894 start_codon:yes stop_codon:yes gene_type:complete
MSTGSASWVIQVLVPTSEQDNIANILERHINAISIFPDSAADFTLIRGYTLTLPDLNYLKSELKNICLSIGINLPEISVDVLPAIDWLAVNRKSFAPIKVGRIWIRDSYHNDPPPFGSITIVVDAATAFGTGHHPTTKGCLIALDYFYRRRGILPSGPVLDMGCGTGILGMAAAKCLRRKVIASDIDAVAVAKSRYNFRLNNIQTTNKFINGPGYTLSAIKNSGPYALIFANILARPLVNMAPNCARNIRPGGYAILSGLLIKQERQVIAAHRQQGLIVFKRFQLDGWSTLVLRRQI